MRLIGILYNRRAARARALAGEIAAWAERRDQRVRVCVREDLSPDTPWLHEADLLMTLGGDGTILRAAQAAAPRGALVLGINLGRVGFLAESEPDVWREVLTRVLEGDYWVEERMMLRAVARRNGKEIGRADALNDVVVGRGERARVVHLSAEIDGGHLATYVADGLIVATPTGSTAYALAAGGPVLPPQLRNILLVPVSPHLSMERPVVLSEGVTVRIVISRGRPAVLTVDGGVQAELSSGDDVLVEASPHLARFARVQERTYFYKTLVQRLVPRNHQFEPSED